MPPSEVNQHPIAEVMLVLLKSGQSAWYTSDRIPLSGLKVSRGVCQAESAKLWAGRLSPSFQRHRSEVNQHPIAEVMLVLLKSGQSASREEAVEEMKDCRSMKQHRRRSTLGEKGGTPPESSWNSIGFGFISIAFYIDSSMNSVTNLMLE
ncbi:hypothetical protein F2Q70_00026448 [Brassica cretica]|uniref:Uncharacterized protein n=1 Tax=Brassica cretica TaxID=69181 RepID=A0A8S9L3C9_BRACR|nr:hypothetical protein F2Q70_00026448 [Brassica cretica]